MASAVNINVAQRYPNGTTVKAFALPALPLGELTQRLKDSATGNPESAPFSLTKLGEAAVANGQLVLSGLENGVVYLLWAEVAGTQVYMYARGGSGVSSSQTSTSPNTVLVKTTSTEVLPANLGRQGLSIVNTGTTNMYLGLGKAAVLKEGILLEPGGSWDGVDGDELWTGSVFGIAETGQESATVIEV
jgi:hypothetical protein